MTKTILLVDDEPDMLEMLTMRLEKVGYKVITAVTGEECLEKTEEKYPDLILLDVVMPGKNGCEVMRELRGDEVTRAIPVIIFTAHYPEEEYIKMSAGDIGADDYILKPFDVQALLAKIKFLIK